MFWFTFFSIGSLTLGDVILNRKLFNRNTTVSTNYTIIYKHIRAELSGLISFIEFECPNCVCEALVAILDPNNLILFFCFFFAQNLTGVISHETNVGPYKETVVSATLNITNGTDVEVWVRIFGFGASMSSRIFTDPFTVEILGDKLFEPKSFALVYAHNDSSQTRYPSIHMGERQPGDHLLKVDSKFIQRTSTTNFPEAEFEFSQTNGYLTQISFSFSVCIPNAGSYVLRLIFHISGHFVAVADGYTLCEQHKYRRQQFRCHRL